MSESTFKCSVEAWHGPGFDREVSAADEQHEFGGDSHLVEEGAAHLERCPAVVLGMGEYHGACPEGRGRVAGVILEP